MSEERPPEEQPDEPLGQQPDEHPGSQPDVDSAEKGWEDEHSAPFEDPDEKKKFGCSPLFVFALLSLCLVLAAIMVPNFIRARSRGQLTACKSNLKNIGTAFEMYSTDWSGKYPATMDLLTPNYLKTIPECPAAGSVTYTMETGESSIYNTAGFQDYYFVQCEGPNHKAVSVPRNYPQYDGIQGLIDR